MQTGDSNSQAVVSTVNDEGGSNILLACEHASPAIPPEFGDLGLSAEARLSHAAWDIGAMDVARHLSRLLDATLVASQVSRLVYDCNRPPDAPDAMPERVERYDVPGNTNMTQEDRARRIVGVYRPFETAIATALERIAAPILVTVHSFTRVYQGRERAVELGILHDRDARMADAIIDAAGRHTALRVERNAPYGPEDGVMHTLKLHGQGRGIPNVMLEIRNDLIATPQAAQGRAEELAPLLRDAARSAGFELQGAQG